MTIHTPPRLTEATTMRPATYAPLTRASKDAGPTARLVALPQLDGGLPSTLAGVDEHLARIERARQSQMDALPSTPSNVVAAAHRRIVERILVHVRSARARVRAGTYGTCVHCGTSVGERVLEREPWQTACGSCDPSTR